MEKRLGKGLEALIPENIERSKAKVSTLKLSDIVPNRLQPRTIFKEEPMEDLKNSIREKGVIQPVLVRLKDNVYELIAGERRWRAAKELNLEEIPAIVKDDINDVSSLELSLIENIQREELNPIEEAKAYKNLIEKFGYTLDFVGKTVGKDKTTISNSLRLLNLSTEIQKCIEEGSLSTGHGKVLLSIANDYRRDKLAKTVIKHSLSVRQLEQMIARRSSSRKKVDERKSPEIERIEEELQHHLGTRVTVIDGKKRGKIEIQYFSNTDLERILDIIMKNRET